MPFSHQYFLTYTVLHAHNLRENHNTESEKWLPEFLLLMSINANWENSIKLLINLQPACNSIL